MNHNVTSDRLNTIMMVEDNLDHQELIMVALKKYAPDSRIVALSDGKEALDYLFCTEDHDHSSGQFPPNMILLDLKLPKVDGLEVLKRIKGDSILKNIPVYMLTTSSATEDMQRCYRAGVNRYVTKPPDFLKMMEAIQELLDFTKQYQMGMLNAPRGVPAGG